MNRLWERTDRWLHEAYPVDALGLGLLRIVTAALVLLVFFPRTRWFAELPDSIVAGPPGPLRWLTGTPPELVISGLEVLLAVAAVALLVGWRTVWASVLVGVLGLSLTGMTYTFGKIDHLLVVWLVPLVMSGSGWGARLSLDAGRRAGSRVSNVPTALLAVCLSLIFLTGAIPKIATGWLSPSSQAVQYHTFRYFFTSSNHALFAEQAVHSNAPAVWELLDWATVVLESGFILVVLFPTLFRLWLGLATTFHLGVYLTLNIAFIENLVGYLVFLPWGLIALRVGLGGREPSRRSRSVPGAVVALGGGVLAAGVLTAIDRAPLAALVSTLGGNPRGIDVTLLTIGAVAGVLAMAVESRRLLTGAPALRARRTGGRSGAAAPSVEAGAAPPVDPGRRLRDPAKVD